MPKRMTLLVIFLVLVGILAPGLGRPAAAQYAQVTILAHWDSRAEQDDFQRLLLPFFKEYNVQPTLIAAADLSQTLAQQTAAQTPPDIMILGEPGLLREYAAAGQLVDLGAALGTPPANYPASLVPLGTVDGVEYGRFIRLALDGLGWVNPLLLTRAGFTLPTAWDGLFGLTPAAGDPAAWALGLSGGDSGTDVIEAILLSQSGAEMVNGLANGSIRWTDERVRGAWEQFGALLDLGTPGDPAQITPLQAALAPFTGPPTAYVGVGPSTAWRWITDQQPRLSESDLAFFALAGDGSAPLISGDLIALFNDQTITAQLAAYLADPATAADWAALGSAIAPYPGADYPAGLLGTAAAQIHNNNNSPVFDLSDRLPPDVRAAFLDGVARFTADRGALDAVLGDIQAAAEQAN